MKRRRSVDNMQFTCEDSLGGERSIHSAPSGKTDLEEGSDDDSGHGTGQGSRQTRKCLGFAIFLMSLHPTGSHFRPPRSRRLIYIYINIIHS